MSIYWPLAIGHALSKSRSAPTWLLYSRIGSNRSLAWTPDEALFILSAVAILCGTLKTAFENIHGSQAAIIPNGQQRRPFNESENTDRGISSWKFQLTDN